MKLQIFSVYDKAVQAYLPPFYVRSKGEALRSFSDACNDEKHQFKLHSADYYLVFLGEFDDSGAVFECCDPVRIISAVECLVDEVFTPGKEVEDVGKKVKRLPM